MLKKLIAFVFDIKQSRLELLAYNKEFDHLLQPINQREYLAAYVLRIFSKT